MKYDAENYVGKKIRLYPGDYKAKYGIIRSVDDLGFIVEITESSCSSYKVGQRYFISHSSNFRFEFI